VSWWVVASTGLVQISDEDRAMLVSWARSSSVRAGLALRARIVLAAAAGEGTSAIARRIGVSRPTVIQWRDRYARAGLDGLHDAPRSGRPKSIDDSDIIAATLEPPADRLGVAHWSTRLLGSVLGISDATVARAWRRYGVQPWRRETFKFSTDPQLEVQDDGSGDASRPGERDRQKRLSSTIMRLQYRLLPASRAPSGQRERETAGQCHGVPVRML
jgi:transposase